MYSLFLANGSDIQKTDMFSQNTARKYNFQFVAQTLDNCYQSSTNFTSILFQALVISFALENSAQIQQIFRLLI
jgi:hypothetical protein